MKREGRQHGMVRSFRILPAPSNPRPESRFVNRLDSPPTAGLFTKVSTKPTNHSKFTGKCGRARCVGCHVHPASKSKDKCKGTQKLRSGDNFRLVTWRVVDSKPGLNFSGFSATGVLDHLANNDYLDDDDHDYDCEDEVYEDSCDLAHHHSVADFEIASGAVEIEENDDRDGENKGDDYEESEDTSFCDVALVWEDEDEDEDEGWCLVA